MLQIRRMFFKKIRFLFISPITSIAWYHYNHFWLISSFDSLFRQQQFWKPPSGQTFDAIYLFAILQYISIYLYYLLIIFIRGFLISGGTSIFDDFFFFQKTSNPKTHLGCSERNTICHLGDFIFRLCIASRYQKISYLSHHNICIII